MEPVTVAALRQALADLSDDATVIDAASGQHLVDVDTDTDTGQAVLMFLDTATSRRRNVVNTVHGNNGGLVVQTGGDFHGHLRL